MPLPLDRSDLLTIVAEFRKGILDGRESEGMCYAVCAPLQAYLSHFHGIESELVGAELKKWAMHVWLKLSDGTIIDPTADQFDMAPVYIGPLPDMYKGVKHERRRR